MEFKKPNNHDVHESIDFLAKLLWLPRVSFWSLFSDVFFLLEDSRRHRNLLKSVSIDQYRAAFFRFLGSEFPLSTDLSFSIILVVVCTPLFSFLHETTNLLPSFILCKCIHRFATDVQKYRKKWKNSKVLWRK